MLDKRRTVTHPAGPICVHCGHRKSFHQVAVMLNVHRVPCYAGPNGRCDCDSFEPAEREAA